MTLPSCMKEGNDWRTDLAYFKHRWIKLPIGFIFPLPRMSFCMCTCALWLLMYIHTTQKVVQSEIFHYQRNKSISCKWVNSICYRISILSLFLEFQNMRWVTCRHFLWILSVARIRRTECLWVWCWLCIQLKGKFLYLTGH